MLSVSDLGSQQLKVSFQKLLHEGINRILTVSASIRRISGDSKWGESEQEGKQAGLLSSELRRCPVNKCNTDLTPTEWCKAKDWAKWAG